MISSVFLAFQHGTELGLLFLLGTSATAPIVFWLSFKALPNTAIGRRLILRGPSFEPRESLVREAGIEAMPGKRGESVTELRPSGTVVIDGKRWDALTRGEMLDAGVPIEVVRIEMSQLVVRRLSATEQAPSQADPAAGKAPSAPDGA